MSDKTLSISDTSGKLQHHLYDYLLSVSLREPDILTQLRQATISKSHRKDGRFSA